MINSKTNKILILGADGLVGRTVFLYIKLLFPTKIWGTTRCQDKVGDKKLFFAVESYKQDLHNIFQNCGQIDYIINCIAVTDIKDHINNLITVNSSFPHCLEEEIAKYNSRLIHISTDAVFSTLSGKVHENSQVSPESQYGSSKYLGETSSSRALTIRSSFIGFDKINHQGLLEKVIMNGRKFKGNMNQLWTGCTTIQFSNFCIDLIFSSIFERLRQITPVFHFTPLGPISKYNLLKIFINLAELDISIIKAKDRKIDRVLVSNYIDLPFISKYTKNITIAINELIEFEKKLL